jgi:hypothetical protein
MSATYPKISLSVFLSASLLLPASRLGQAQSTAANTVIANVSPESSSSLPDAPVPQNAASPAPPAASSKTTTEEVTVAGTPRRFLMDQKAIWTSPLHIQPQDAIWLLPLAATTGVLLGSDHHTMTSLIHINPTDQSHFNTLSDAGVAALGAMPAGMFLWSLGHDAPQARETSILTGEALADSLTVNQVFKVISRRDRPYVNDAQGHFFSSSPLNSSFPSDHATAAWAMASVIGDEYPGWATRTAVYGLAAGVSVSRVLAEQHFPSDVLVGSATGWLIGHFVYRAHHNFSLNPFDSTPMPGDYGAPRKPKVQSSTIHYPPDPIAHRPPRLFDADTDPDSIGSTNVPMDSWIYPALERLAAMGFIPGQSVAIRPWTRQECLRQLKLAEDLASMPENYSRSALSEAHLLMTDLHNELETNRITTNR